MYNILSYIAKTGPIKPAYRSADDNRGSGQEWLQRSGTGNHLNSIPIQILDSNDANQQRNYT